MKKKITIIKIILIIFVVVIIVKAWGYNEISLQTSEAYVFVTKWGKNGSGEGEFGHGGFLYKITDKTIESLKGKIIKEKLEMLKTLKNKEEMSEYELMDNLINLKSESKDGLSKLKFEPEEVVIVCMEAIFSKNSGPKGIAVDELSNVYIADSYNNRIEKFDSDGNFIMQWGNFGDNNGQFKGVAGLIADKEGHIYVSDEGNERIQEFDLDGNFIKSCKLYKPWSEEPCYPSGIAIAPDGYLYTIHCKSEILKCDFQKSITEKWLKIINAPIDSTGSITDTIAIDNSGYIYISFAEISKVLTSSYLEAIFLDSTIVKFNSSGEVIEGWNIVYDNESEKICSIGGMAIDPKGNLYVVDNEKHCVQKFSSNGEFLCKWGKKGISDGEFLYPEGIAVDAEGNVYVMDSGNFRVQKFSLDTALEETN